MRYYIKIALQHLAMGLIIPIAIIWKMQNGLSVSEAILTESLILLVTAIADLPAGLIANRINNRRSLVLGAFLHLVGLILLVTGGSLLVFILAAIITGVAWAFVSGADEAYLHDDFIEDTKTYKKHFSVVTIVDEAFTVLGMLLASLLLYSNVPMRGLFITASVILAIHLIYTLFFLPKSRMIAIIKPGHQASRYSLHIFKSKALIALLPLMVAFAVIYEAGRPLWQPHMQANGVDIAAFGVLFALLKLASIGGSILSGMREFARKDLFVVFGIMLISLLIFGTSFATISIIGLCAYLFTENYFRVYMSTIMNARIKHHRAAVLSIASVVRNTTGALIVAGAGILSTMSIFLAISCLVIIKVPAILYIIRSAKERD